MPTYTTSPSDNGLICIFLDGRHVANVNPHTDAGRVFAVGAVGAMNAEPALRHALTECVELIEDMHEDGDARGDFYNAVPAVLAIARRALDDDTTTPTED